MTPLLFRLRRVLPVLVGLILLQACAVPVPPTGGPPDTTPPSLVTSEPVSGAVSVSTDRLVFEFSEPVDEASFVSAFSITPEFGAPVDVRGSSRRLEVRLPESLREGTTYRVTLDVSLRDRRGVSLDAPITLAFATGPEIDTARLSGRILHATDGSAATGIDVLAFAAADSSSLNNGPLYRTQTGGDGSFRLEYLPSESFFIVGLQDRNRNRLIDEGEWIAVPPMAAVRADTSDSKIEEPWLLSNPDRTPPKVDRVRAVAEGELEIRMSEALALMLDDPIPPVHDLSVSDSTGTRTLPVTALWFRQDRPRNLYARVEDLAPGLWTLQGQLALADSVGNAAADPVVDFVVPEGMAPMDPVRLLTWTPDSLDTTPGLETIPEEVRTIWPMERPGFRLNVPDSIVSVVFTDSTGQELGVTARREDATWWTWTSETDLSDPYKVSVTTTGQDSTRSIWLRSATARELGALGMVVNTGDLSAESIRGHLYPVSGGGRLTGKGSLNDDMMLFDGLPGGFRGRLMVFFDQDGDGKWSPGSLIPHVPAEPVRWYQFREPVRPRWDTIAEDSLSFVPGTSSVPTSETDLNE